MHSVESRSKRYIVPKLTLGLLTTLGAGIGIGDLLFNSSNAASSGSKVAVGEVMCADNKSVEGVWLSAGPSSGWANVIQGPSSSIEIFSRALHRVGSYTVHVGCGGSPKHWSLSDYANSDATANMPVGFLCEPTVNPSNHPKNHGICEQVGLIVLGATS